VSPAAIEAEDLLNRMRSITAWANLLFKIQVSLTCIVWSPGAVDTLRFWTTCPGARVKALGMREVREVLVETGLAGTVSAETAVTTGRLVWAAAVGSAGRATGADAVDWVVGVEGNSILIWATVVVLLAAASLTAAVLSFCCLLRLAFRWLDDFFVFATPCCCWWRRSVTNG
jgi:hypothetical protein